jgi:anthranilate synthase component 1
MRASGKECFLLESVEGGETMARYTFLGCGPSARLTIRGRDVFEETGGKVRRLTETPLAALERLTVRPGFEGDGDLPPLSSGAVGYLGYDAVRLFEKIPDRHPKEGAVPDGLFLLFEAVVAFDHPRQRLLLLTNLAEASDVDAAIKRLDALEMFLWSDAEKRARKPLRRPRSFP